MLKLDTNTKGVFYSLIRNYGIISRSDIIIKVVYLRSVHHTSNKSQIINIPF